jgi:hypothetical protein
LTSTLLPLVVLGIVVVSPKGMKREMFVSVMKLPKQENAWEEMLLSSTE